MCSSDLAAALLHDIGHIIDDQAMPTHDLENLDDSHEARAYDWLKEHFGVAVADPVRLHVAAKRYLCTVEPEYQSQLSPTSLKSFYDQGGTMSSEEREEFEREVYYHQAVQLRRWDDLAKDPLMPLPAIDTFAPLLDSILEANRRQI